MNDGARQGRHLPFKSDRYVLPARTQLLPKDVYTADCPFLHPDAVVNEHVTDGQTVNVDLYSSVELDAYGIPILSKWAVIAFYHDERHRIIRESKSPLANG